MSSEIIYASGGHRYKLIRALRDLDVAMKELREGKPEAMHVSCINCDQFNEKTEICSRYRERPPARWIAYGCADWTNIDDDIPF